MGSKTKVKAQTSPTLTEHAFHIDNLLETIIHCLFSGFRYVFFVVVEMSKKRGRKTEHSLGAQNQTKQKVKLTSIWSLLQFNSLLIVN